MAYLANLLSRYARTTLPRLKTEDELKELGDLLCAVSLYTQDRREVSALFAARAHELDMDAHTLQLYVEKISPRQQEAKPNNNVRRMPHSPTWVDGAVPVHGLNGG